MEALGGPFVAVASRNALVTRLLRELGSVSNAIEKEKKYR
jgi:hypothetical protein